MRSRKPKQPASLWEVVNRDRLKNSKSGKAAGTKAKVQPQSDSSGNGRGFKFPFSKRLMLIVLLIIVVIILIAFRLGQSASDETQKAVDKEVLPDRKAILPALPDIIAEKQDVVAEKEQSQAKTEAVKDHVIVITSYQVSRDLEPVRKYFRQHNIETEIDKPAGSIFYRLITKKKYDNPEKKGTDGYFAKQKIKKIGSGYKAPKGYEPFGRTPFQDAYGMKVKK